MILVGDPRRFSAVGRGGMFSHLTTTYGAIELDQVHRFESRWEREASLRLRNGDPSVLVEYDRRGRLHDGTAHDMETELLEAWRRARVRGGIRTAQIALPEVPSIACRLWFCRSKQRGCDLFSALPGGPEIPG